MVSDNLKLSATDIGGTLMEFVYKVRQLVNFSKCNIVSFVKIDYFRLDFLTDYQFIIINTFLKYRSFLGILLAILVVNAVLLQDLHRLVAHQHDRTLHCEAGDSDTHIHGEEFLVTNCIVCCFQFSPSEQIDAILPIVIAPFVHQEIQPLTYLNLCGATVILAPPRGPPTHFA